MSIGIAGAGGIGSNVAQYLVRSGLTCLKIIDYDTVAPSNLNRQFYFADQIGNAKVEMLALNLSRISSKVDIRIVNQRLTADNIVPLFADCEIIVEGFDVPADKKMLLEKFSHTKRMIVSACGIAGSDLDTITTKKIGSCFIVGDFAKDCRDHALFAHKVSAVAAKMAELILTCGGAHG